MKNRYGAQLQIITAMIIFGTIGIFVRFIPYPSSIIALIRGILGTVTLLLVLVVKRKKLSFAAVKSNLLVLGVSGAFIGINWILLFEAYRYTTVATATLCYYLAPTFIIVASIFVFKEKLTLKKGVCVVLALLGMLFVSGVLEQGMKGANDLKGIILGVLAAGFYAAVIILNKKLRDISAFDGTIIQLAAASIVLLPYTLITEDFTALDFSGKAVAMLLFVGIIHTGLAYALYFGSIQRLKAQTAAIFSYIDPVVAVLASTFILHEKMSLLGMIGAVLVLGSTFYSELN